MNTALLLLLTLAVATGPARTLRCHVCHNASNCKLAVNCQDNASYCKTTTTVGHLQGNLVQKECAVQCVPSGSAQAHGGTIVQCCRGDLCNDQLQNSASQPLGSALLGVAAGLLMLFLGL